MTQLNTDYIPANRLGRFSNWVTDSIREARDNVNSTIAGVVLSTNSFIQSDPIQKNVKRTKRAVSIGDRIVHYTSRGIVITAAGATGAGLYLLGETIATAVDNSSVDINITDDRVNVKAKIGTDGESNQVITIHTPDSTEKIKLSDIENGLIEYGTGLKIAGGIIMVATAVVVLHATVPYIIKGTKRSYRYVRDSIKGNRTGANKQYAQFSTSPDKMQVQ